MILNRNVPAGERPLLELPTVVEDSYGDKRETWDPPQLVELPRGSQVQDRSSYELVDGVKRVSGTDRVLFVPGPPRFDHTARIRFGGKTFRLQGDPVVHRGLRGAVYTTSVLVRKEGA